MSMQNVESVLVVGGGIIGASIAWRLAQSGVRVTLFEAHSAAALASSNSYGWINATAAESADYFQLRMQAIADYHDMLAPLSADSPATRSVKFNGSVWWEVQGQELTDLGARLHNYGHTLRQIDAHEFSKLEPNVANPPESCLYSESDGAAEGAQLTRFFLHQASLLGASVLMGASVLSLTSANGQVTGASTSHGDFSADVVVLAAGVGTQSLAESVGITLPMDNRRGLIVHTHPVSPVLSRVVNAEDIHFRQAADGHIVMGEIFSGGMLGMNQGDSPVSFADELLRRLKKRLPAVEGLAIDRVQLGLRPVPEDGFPAIGMPAALAGLYIATTHSGITLAPLLGRLVTEELVEGKRSSLLAAYHPDRFSLH